MYDRLSKDYRKITSISLVADTIRCIDKNILKHRYDHDDIEIGRHIAIISICRPVTKLIAHVRRLLRTR